MTRFKLVPVEPTEEMLLAGDSAPTRLTGTGTATAVDLVYRAMLQAAPEPSPEMVDELCKAMWLDHHWCWGKGLSLDDDDELAHDRRDVDRARMRAFLQRIGEQKP